MTSTVYTRIPIWNNGTWEYTEFSTKQEFRDYVKGLFKEPGKYEFDETTLEWNKNARKFQKDKLFCVAPEGSRDFQEFWDTEKEKCKKGVIYLNNGKEWYLPRQYYMWMNYLPIYDKVKGKLDFPRVWDSQYHVFLYELLAQLSGKHAAETKKRQWGNLQPNSYPILARDGWKLLGELQVGDVIWNPDGTLQTVEQIFEHPQADQYEVEFIDGRKTLCGLEHNWYVLDKGNKKNTQWKVLTTRDMLERGYYNLTTANTSKGKKVYKGYKFAIPYTAPITFENVNLPVDPYILGAILGDGCIGKSIRFATMDKSMVDEILTIVGDDYFLTEDIRENNKSVRYTIKYKYRNGKDCPLSTEFNKLGLRDSNCYNKYIPEIYKHSSVEQRISVIQGLMDTDGYINTEGKDIHYTTVSKQLAEDFAYICRSLGLQCRTDKKDAQKDSHKDFYRVRISGVVNFSLFRLPRKLQRQQLRKNEFENCSIIAINKLDRKEDSRCIIVSNPNRLYITNDFIVTHNTYMKMARQICRFWFDEGYTGRIGASLKDYINEKGAWKFLNQYRDFLNRHTAWYRGLDPEKTFSWQQRIRIREGGRDSYEGLKSSISGTSFEKDPTAGVGGNTDEFYHEEAGIAPKLHMTYEFMRPAMSAGGIATGLFIASGSVGDLDQCQPLRNFMEHPDDNGFLGVETDLLDEHGTRGVRGLFIPEQWSYEVEGDKEPCIDQWGNSLVEKALIYIKEEREQWKKTLSAEMYQLRISQKPINIKEAFAIRKTSLFPIQYTGPQVRRIEDGEYALEYVDLIRDKDNTIKTVSCDRTPCEYPTDMRNADKRGVVVIHERPIEGAKPLVTYIGSVDPVAKGIAQHSDSLACIYIYKMPVEVLKKHSDGTTDTFMEGGKIVAWWTGRYDDVNDTNEHISRLIEYYQAYTTVEYNVGSLVNYMIGKRRQKYLAVKDDMIFDAELGIKQGVSIPYGWYKTQSVWGKLLEYAIDSLSTITAPPIEDEEGNIKEIHYGVERIPDIWLLKEMDEYDPKSGNYDRIVAYAALMAFADLRSTLLSGLYKKQEKVIREEDKLEDTNFMPTFNTRQGPFRNLVSGTSVDIFGRQKTTNTWKRGNPFRNL